MLPLDVQRMNEHFVAALEMIQDMFRFFIFGFITLARAEFRWIFQNHVVYVSERWLFLRQNEEKQIWLQFSGGESFLFGLGLTNFQDLNIYSALQLTSWSKDFFHWTSILTP